MMTPNMLYGFNASSDQSIINYEHSYHHSHFVREHTDLEHMYTRGFLYDFYQFLPQVIIHREAAALPISKAEVSYPLYLHSSTLPSTHQYLHRCGENVSMARIRGDSKMRCGSRSKT